MLRLALPLLLLASASAGPVGADGQRPRIGLVLSGGGARGAAHVGVLRVLEELRVPVDVVAGTSMGAIVGGLYASGLEPDEIAARLEETDWALAFEDETPRELLTLRRKRDARRFLVDLELGFRPWRLLLPKGLLQGQKLGLILETMTLHVAGVDDFDELFLPFRAVAADLATGELVVMESGSLASAMRASMSVPGVFAPVVRDGRTLVDGGIARNLPVDVARELGADVVIAVDISSPLQDREALSSALGVTGQMISILMRENTERQKTALGPDDLLLVPALGELGSADFHRSAEAIEVGEAAAREHRVELLRLAVSAEEHARWRSRRERPAQELPRIRSVVVDNDSRLGDAAIRSRLTVREGEVLDPDRLRDDLARVYGFGIFESVDYTLTEHADGVADLLIRAREKSWGPSYLQFALNLEHDFEGSNAFGLGVSNLWHPINRFGAEWRNELEVGSLTRVFSEYWQPLDREGRWFVAPSFEYRREGVDLFVGGERVAEFEVNAFEYALAAGRQLSNWGEVRIGMRLRDGEVERSTGDPAISDVDFEQGSWFARATYDTLDDSSFPHDGELVTAELHLFRKGLDAAANFETLEFEASSAQSAGLHTLVGSLGFATNLDENAEAQNLFPIGGFLNLSGLDQRERFGNHVGLGRLVYYRSLGSQEGVPFDVPLYAGTSLELGGAFDTEDDITGRNAIWAGSVFVGADTFLGPVLIGFGVAEGGSRALTLFVGSF